MKPKYEITVKERDEKYRPWEISFTPPSHIHPLSFRRGCSCGPATRCLHVSGYDTAGGVMTLEQMKALRELLNLSIAEGA